MEATYFTRGLRRGLCTLTSQCFKRKRNPSFKMEWLVLRVTNTLPDLGDKWLILEAQSKGVSRCPTPKSMTEFLRMTKPSTNFFLVPSVIPNMEYSKVGRGGAGNFYSQRDVHAVSKRAMEVKQCAGRVDIR